MSSLPLFHATKSIEANFHQEAEIVAFHGDVADFVKQIPDESMTLIITSPPYNLGKIYEDRTTISNYLEAQSGLIAELFRTLKQNGSICWQVGNFVEEGEIYPLDIFYYPIFKKLGMKLRNRIIWTYGHGLHSSKRFSGRYETILWFTKSDDYIFNLDAVRVPSKYPGKRHFKGPNRGKPSGNPLGKNPSDVWEILVQDWEALVWDIPNVKSNHPEKTIHPCQFPIELAERCILALTREQDWVFDPYMGVGSALVAAAKHGRRAMGCDKEADYVEIARKRLSDHFNGTLGYRPIGKPVYQPTGREKVSQVPEEWKETLQAQATEVQGEAE
jgi:adenine-specific DNA-methyltransferase